MSKKQRKTESAGKIRILTYGCSNNVYEGEIIAGILEEAGYSITDSDQADIFVVNMCAVKSPTEKKIMKRIAQLSGEGKRIIVTGCIPAHLVPGLKKTDRLSMVNTHNIDRIADVVESSLAGERLFLMAQKKLVKIVLPKKEQRGVISIIPICSGCKGSCSYCSVKAIKGEIFSYPIQDIVNAALNALKHGAKELWITSQDNAAYEYCDGKNSYDLADLLKSILDLDHDFKLRLGMMNPDHVLNIADRLIKVYKHRKMFKFLHIPLQAASSSVLKNMNRFYTLKDFESIVSKFRKAIPDITISTDIICGFPGETEKDFDETLTFVKKLKPAVINISRYWPRPGTAALRLPGQLHGKVTKQRSQELTKVFKEFVAEDNKRWIGWKGKALIDEIGKDNSFVGRNDFYRPVILKGRHNLGDIVEVEVKSVTAHDLRI